MIQTFASFSARLGEFIRQSSRLPSGPCTAEAQAEFNTLALALFSLQFEHNSAYRNLCLARGMSPGRTRHWTQIPPAPTAAFKELELSSIPPSSRTMVFHSSGTTGQQPSRHFHDTESLRIYEASLLPWFQRHLLPETNGDSAGKAFQFISLTPPAAAAPHSSLVHMFDLVHRVLGETDSFFAGNLTEAGNWSLDTQKLMGTIEGRSRPVTLLGTAFTFVGLLDGLARQSLRLRLPAGSRVLETGGYKGRSRSLPKPELHALITDRLGIASDHVVGEYGMSELSSQAYDSVAGIPVGTGPETRQFQFPPWARAQIISPENGREVGEGETGLVRVFDLANVFSVMAVQTEDLGVRCGNGFELLGRAVMAEPRGCSLMAD